MKFNKILKSIAVTSAAFLLMSMSAIFAHATSSAEFSIPKKADAGKDFSVSVTFTADKDIGTVTAMLTYDDTVAEFKPSNDAWGGSGVVNLKGFPDEVSKEMTFKINFTALKSGVCKMNLTNCFILSPDGDQLGSPNAYANVTVTGNGTGTQTTAPDASSIPSHTDANGQPVKGYLKSLTVSEGVLKPNFSFDIYDYHVDVDNSVETCEIEGETASDTDHIWYTGSEFLAVGNNVRTIKVTDEDGNSHIYTITITRAGEDSSADAVSEVMQDSSEPYQTEISDVDSNKNDPSAANIIDDDNDGLAKYRKILTPALVIILIALIIALVVLIVWLKKKSTENKNSKTKSRKKKK